MTNLYLLANFGYPFDRKVGEELLCMARDMGDIRMMTAYSENPMNWENVINAPRNVDVVLGLFRESTEFGPLLERNIPVIQLSSYEEVEGVHQVCDDNEEMARTSFCHLREKGYRHFCGLSFETSYSIEQTRLKHFEEIALQQGASSVSQATLFRRDEGKAFLRKIRTLPKPLGLYAPTSVAAAMAVHVLLQAGVSVPKEVGVVTEDRDDLTLGICEKTLTFVRSDYRAIATDAIQLARTFKAGSRRKAPVNPVRRLIPPAAVDVGESSDMMVVADPVLHRALLIIAEEGGDLLAVDQVASKAGVSRRALEHRFVDGLGITAGKFLKRRLMERAKSMLHQQDLSIDEIAVACGYAERPSFHLAFKRMVGMTPVQYRNQTSVRGRGSERA